MTGVMEHCHMPREAEWWARRSGGKLPFVCPDTARSLTASIGLEVSTSKWHFSTASQGLTPPPSNLLTTTATTQDPQPAHRVQESGGSKVAQAVSLPVSREAAGHFDVVRPQFQCANPALFPPHPSQPRHPHLHQVVCYDFMIIYGALSGCSCTFTTPSWSPLITGPRR